MNLCLGIFVAVATILITLTHQPVAAEVAEKACTAVLSDVTKKQLNGIAGCTKSLNFKSGKEKKEKMTCILKCVLKKESGLDAKGQAGPDQLGIFIKTHLPPSMWDKANATFTPCYKVPENGFDDSDEFCKDYDLMVKCLLGVIPTLCK